LAHDVKVKKRKAAGGGEAAGPWGAELAHDERGKEKGGGGRAGRGSAAPGELAQERGGVSYFLFSYNRLLSAYFMETKQLHTREN
jgi:hypothetical protein